MDERQIIVTRSLFGLLALVVGAVAGVYAFNESSSWWLAIFVGLIVLYTLSRAVPDVITDPDKGRRGMFFGIPLVTAVGGLVGAYALWEEWWLAVLIGLGAGAIGWAISMLSFPEIAAEEQQDSLARTRGGFAQAVSRPVEPSRDPALEELLRVTGESGITFTADEELWIARAYAAGNHDEIARLIERKAAKVPVGAGA